MGKVDMENPQVIKASTEHFNDIKNLMLVALKEDPKGFSVSFNEYNNNSDFWWFSYINPYITGGRDVFYLSLVNGKIVGMAGIAFENKERKKHVGLIVWMYILKEFRGKGISKKLMEAIIGEAKKEKLLKLTLFVNNSQIEALNLYKNLGFQIAGTLKSDLKIDSQFIDTNIMELFL